MAIADEDEDLRALLPPSRSRLPLYVGGALVVLIAAGLFLARPSTEPAPVPPPSPVVEVEAPPEAAPPVVISEAPPTEPVVEIEAPQPEAAAELAEGIRHYESGRFRQAVAVLEPATVRDAEAVQPWLYLGLARFEVGDRAGAEVAVQRVLAREPRNGRAIMLLATLHLDQGRKEEARAQLRRYLELYPDGPHARDAQRLLR